MIIVYKSHHSAGVPGKSDHPFVLNKVFGFCGRFRVYLKYLFFFVVSSSVN